MHLVLDAKRIPYHTVNINLFEKPEWLFEANPFGKVPCLQLVDQPGAPFVYESLLITEYLDEVYPEPKLYPTDPLKKLVEKLWIERFGPVFSKFYQAYQATDKAAAIVCWNDARNLLDDFEVELTRRGTTYFGGDRRVNMVDYAIWPFIQFFEIAGDIFGKDNDLNGERYPTLVKN